MEDVKEERIMQAFYAQLDVISLANGYRNDIKSIQRFEMSGNDFVDVPLLIVQLGEVSPIGRVQPNGVREQATILVAAYVRNDKTIDPRSTDAVLISLDADIYQAMMQDRKLGGLIQDISRTAVFFDDIEEPVRHVGRVSEFTIQYTHTIDSVVN